MKKKFFKYRLNSKLEINEKKFLLPMLTPTSKGTKYWEPSPEGGKLTKRYFGRVLLQLHQILGLLYSLNIETKNKKFLDIGTGNALIPQLFLNYTDISSATGVDPYEENEHVSSWQPSKTSENLKQIISFINNNSDKKNFFFKKYKKFINLENFSFIPSDIKLKISNNKKEFKKFKIDAHKLGLLNEKFDIIYCKAIEHIPNWELVFQNINKVSRNGSTLYFKHRSFFSYLGAHRFSSIGIPWGHVLLNDKEYKKFTKKFYPSRSKEMNRFFFKGLAYPRYSVSDMCEIALKNNFYPIYISSEKPRYFKKILNFTKSISNFWPNIRKNYPRVSSSEILSGMYHIVFKKI